MLIPVYPDHLFAGVFVRLQRADENILNLRSEICRFFQECKYPIMPEPDAERWQDALDYHRSLPIPKRFSVLAGEIFHHWRSCLDHIVWIYSDTTYRAKYETKIQFPVLVESPNSDDRKRFERQIGGISDPSQIRDLIIKFQPYNLGVEAANSPFAIIHKMDRFDKHRELVIVQSTSNLLLPPDSPPELVSTAAAYADNKAISSAGRTMIFRALHEQGKVLPQVAFAEFGNRKNQPVIPSLQNLGSEMEKFVGLFMAAGGN